MAPTYDGNKLHYQINSRDKQVLDNFRAKNLGSIASKKASNMYTKVEET